MEINFDVHAATCAPYVHVATLRAMATVESGMNPYAIGVVNGRLVRQPQNLTEAISTAGELDKKGVRYSAGLIQIYRKNWQRLNLDENNVFDVCTNMRAAQTILLDCYRRASSARDGNQLALRRALSCYYSNNFATGYQQGYVQRVVQVALQGRSSR
jgi:type IV secretion system protein VirB1